MTSRDEMAARAVGHDAIITTHDRIHNRSLVAPATHTGGEAELVIL